MKTKIINKKSIEFLTQYINNPAPTGYEAEGQKLWLKYIEQYVDKTYIDLYGTAVAVINPKAEYKMVIEAHADEISWTVNYITDDGLIYVKRNGGTDHQIAPSKKVWIHTEKGAKIKGVFGWPAIHTRNLSKEESPKVKNLFVDCGCDSKEELEKLGVHVGAVITYEESMDILNDKKIVGKAMDNKMGGFVIAEVARLIKKNKIQLPIGLYIVNSVQEEIGLRGAQMIAHNIKPDLAICTDVTHDTTTPMIEKKIEGEIQTGKGPVLTYGPAVQNNLLQLIIKTAEENKIDFQRLVAGRATGTDTDAFAYSNAGVAAALISFPLKYMHTTVEMLDIKDVEATIQLMYKVVNAIKPNHNFNYF